MNTTRSRQDRERQSADKPARRPKRWRRRMLIALVLLAALLAFANGPGFRWMANKVVAQKLSAAGLEGDFEFGGSVLGGVTLHTVDLKGSKGIESLQIGTASVDYSLWGLLRGRGIDALGPVRVSDLEATLRPNPEAPERKPLSEQLTAVGKGWPTIASIARREFEIAMVDLTFKSADDTNVFVLKDMSLQLREGSGVLAAEAIQLPDGDMFQTVEGQIEVAADDSISLRGLQLEEGFGIRELVVSPPAPGAAFPRAEGEVAAFGAVLALAPEPDSLERLKVELRDGEIDLARAAERFGVELPVTGKLDALQTQIEGRIGEPESISLSGSVAGRHLQIFELEGIIARTQFEMRSESLQLDAIAIDLAGNSVRGGGSIQLGERAPKTPPDLRFSLDLDLGAVEAIANPFELPVSGSVSGNASFGLLGGKLDGVGGDLSSSGLAYRDAKLGKTSLRAEGSGSSSVLTFATELAGTPGANKIDVEGEFNFDALSYSGSGSSSLGDLRQVAEALVAFGVELALAGDAELAWSGSGALRESSHRGELRLEKLRAVLDEGDPISGSLVLGYAPDSLSVADCQLATGRLVLTGDAALADDRLRLTELRLRGSLPEGGDTELARVDASLPFAVAALESPERFLSQEGDLALQLATTQLAFSDIAALLQKELGFKGEIDARLDLGGTLAAPTGKGSIDVRGIAPSGESELAPADASVEIALADQRLRVDGGVTHPDFPPITINGSAPLRPKAIADDPESITRQQFDLHAHCPQTPLSWLQQFIPEMTRAEGGFSAEVHLTGTVDEPSISGRVVADASLIKFAREAMPTATGVEIDIVLEGEEVSLRTCRATLAGGRIEVGGGAVLTSLADPDLALTLNATEALLHRDENLSARANASLALDGPLSAATLSGEVGLVHSHFFREIEILPVGLPRLQSAPSVPRAPSLDMRKGIGIDKKPFADWTLDLKLRTEHPFQIRSNLARGTILADLAITGTGANPIPDGQIEFGENTAATLPFSELRVQEGILQFDKSTGFDPRVRFLGVSRIGRYNVSLRFFGRLSDPRTLISSDPPLPETDALSLLATGRKTEDLANADVLAGKVATLLLDKLRRRAGLGKATDLPASLSDRLDFQAGQIDPKTGKRTASAQLQVSERILLLGDFDTAGDYRGLVKFLIRLR